MSTSELTDIAPSWTFMKEENQIDTRNSCCCRNSRKNQPDVKTSPKKEGGRVETIIVDNNVCDKDEAGNELGHDDGLKKRASDRTG